MKFEAIGHILNTHGLEGILIIAVAKFGSDGVCSLKYLYIGSNNNPDDVLEIESVSIYKHNQYLVKLKNITTSDLAETLKGKIIFLPENQLPETQESTENEDEDLIGYKVFDEKTGKQLGNIDDILEYPAQILLSVRNESREFLVPYVNEFIIDIDESKKTIHIRLIEGLIDED